MKVNPELTKVLVLGATGQQGGSTVTALLNGGFLVKGLTRKPDSPKAIHLKELGVEIVSGDFDHPDSIRNISQGIDVIWFMTTPFERGTDFEIQQGKIIADIAKEVDIKHIVFSSVGSADKNTGIPHFDSKFEVEEYLKSLNLPYTIIAPVFFMDNILAPWNLPNLKEGKFGHAFPSDRKFQMVSLRDIGAFGAFVIKNRDIFVGRRIDFAGDEPNGMQMVEILSKYSKKKIVYESFDVKLMENGNKEMYLMYKWFNDVGYSVKISDLREKYPEVGWLSFAEWVKKQDWSIIK